MKKRLLATFLALCLVMGLLPAGAMAAGGEGEGTPGGAAEEMVSADRFTIYKDGKADGSPQGDIEAGDLSKNAPNLSDQNLYFDHAQVGSGTNSVRVYEAGVFRKDSQEYTYYGSLNGALKILEADETIDLYYVSKYPVTYHCDTAIKTDGDNLVKQGESLTFRAKPSAQDMRLKVTVNGPSVPGTVYDDETGEMIFTVNNVQGPQNVVIAEEKVDHYTLSYSEEEDAFRHGNITSPASGQTITPGGSVTIELSAKDSGPFNYFVLNMLVINGHEVATPPTNAGEGTFVESFLPSGEKVTVTLTSEHNEWWLPDYDPRYTVVISDVHTDLYISEGNFISATATMRSSLRN